MSQVFNMDNGMGKPSAIHSLRNFDIRVAFPVLSVSLMALCWWLQGTFMTRKEYEMEKQHQQEVLGLKLDPIQKDVSEVKLSMRRIEKMMNDRKDQ